jgi:hypothetical protein
VTPMHNSSYTRIRREQGSMQWYALDTQSPDAVHNKYLHEFWNRESKDCLGSKKMIWEFCFAPESRQLMWSQMEAGELGEHVDVNKIKNESEAQGNDDVYNQQIPPCPSKSDSGESYTRLQKKD